MGFALDEAKAAGLRGEVPVGAVLVLNNIIIARAGNSMRECCDPLAHAEMLVIKAGTSALSSLYLNKADLYVTLEPCTMCAAAISLARIRRLYFGATDKKAGAVISGSRFFHSYSCHHRPDVYSGFSEDESSLLLKNFFSLRR